MCFIKKVIFLVLLAAASVCFAETINNHQIKSEIEKYQKVKAQCDEAKNTPIRNFFATIRKPYECVEAEKKLKEIELKGYCLEYGEFRRCGQYGEKDVPNLIRDYTEQSKQCSDDNSQSFPCVKKQLIVKSLESYGYILLPDGTWQDAKPESLRFTPVSDTSKASENDLLKQFNLSKENAEFYEALNNTIQANKYRKFRKTVRVALDQRGYCFDRDAAGEETARKCTNYEILERQRKDQEYEAKQKKEHAVQEKQFRCREYATVFLKSLAWRDGGQTPRQLYNSLSPRYLSKQETKNIINTVYFNERYASLPYFDEYWKIFYTECMKREGGYEPLQ